MISKLTFPFDVDERGGLFLPPSCQPPQSVLSSTFQWAAGLAWLIRTWWQIGLAIGLLAVYYMKLFLNQGITFPFFTKQICNRHSFHIQNRHFPNIQAEISSGFNATIFCLRNSQLIVVNRWQICIWRCASDFQFTQRHKLYLLSQKCHH